MTLLVMFERSKCSFKCSIAISGIAIEQMQNYVPEFIEKLQKLAQTGCVEFLSGTYAASLASVEDPEEFIREVKAHDDLIFRLFGQKPKIFGNTALIYDDDIALIEQSMGLEAAVTDGKACAWMEITQLRVSFGIRA